jgi:glycosyltransferase 2 family protein
MTTVAPPPARWKGLLALGVSLVALAAVIWWAAKQERPQFPSEADRLALVVGAVVIYVVATLFRGWRWHRVMHHAHLDHRAVDAYALVPVGYMGNTVLPARGGEVLRVMLLGERSTARRRELLGSVVSERVLDAASLALLFVMLSVVGIAGNPLGASPAYLTAGGLLLAAVGLFVYLQLRRAGRLQRFADLVRPLAGASRPLLGAAGAALLALTIGVWLLEGVIFWLVGESLSLHISLLEACFVLVLTSFFSLIPAAPGYVGTFEAAILFALGALDVHGGQAFAFALLVRFVLFFPITITGLGLLVVRYGGLRHLRQLRRAEESRA